MIPLIQSVYERDYSRVEQLLGQEGVDINAQDEEGTTALQLACYRNRRCNNSCYDIAKVLIANGAKVNTKNKRGETPLHMVTSLTIEDEIELAKLLIENGADVNAKDNRGETPLHGNPFKELEVVKLLVESGANVNAKDNDGRTPMQCACFYTPKPSEFFFDFAYSMQDIVTKNVEVFIENGAQVNLKDKEGRTALHFACKSDLLEGVIKFMIENGADVNAKDVSGMTPLHVACQEGQSEVVQLLIRRGANAEAECKRGKTPLDLACEGNHLDVVFVLVRQYPWMLFQLSERCRKRRKLAQASIDHFCTADSPVPVRHPPSAKRPKLCQTTLDHFWTTGAR